MISSRPITFLAGRPLGEEFKVRGFSFMVSAPSGIPQDLQFCTDEQSHLRIPVDDGMVYNFPAGFTSIWLFHANSFQATDVALVYSTGKDELTPSGAPAFAGSAGPTKWFQGSFIAGGVTNIGPAPAAGKRQRLLRLAVMMSANGSWIAGGGTSTPIRIGGPQGGAFSAAAAPTIYIPSAPVAAPLGCAFFAQYDFGPTGFLLDAGARLQSSTVATLDTGTFAWEMAYTEE